MPFFPSLLPFASSPIAALLLCVVFVISYAHRQKFGRSLPYRLPPGPRPLPIIGNLHCLRTLPHRDVAKLSKTYGPIMHLRLGSVSAIFISSPSLAEQVLKSNDIVFANRPPSEAGEFMSYGYKGIAFSEHGHYWRGVRKLCIAHLLAPAKINLCEFIRKEEVGNFVESSKEAAKARRVVDVTTKVRKLTGDIVCRAIAGRKCMESMEGRKFCENLDDMMRILGSFDLNVFLPVLSFLDLQRMRRRARAVRERIDKFLEKIIDEHEKLRREEGKKKQQQQQETFLAFLDILLDCMNDKDSELVLDRNSIKAIILEIFGGAMDTSPIAIEWAFTELLRHPRAMKKAREELERVVGLHRMVESSDLPKLPYLAMVVKESLRLHHLGPFLLHYTKHDFNLTGYDIPKGSSVLVCSWAMGRDPNLWPNPEEFVPERFENSCVDIKGRDFHLLPFGSGRRGCPGMSYAMLVVSLVLAQLVHCFDWQLPGGMSPAELDMSEKFGLAMPRAVHLHATPIYRLIGN